MNHHSLIEMDCVSFPFLFTTSNVLIQLFAEALHICKYDFQSLLHSLMYILHFCSILVTVSATISTCMNTTATLNASLDLSCSAYARIIPVGGYSSLFWLAFHLPLFFFEAFTSTVPRVTRGSFSFEALRFLVVWGVSSATSDFSSAPSTSLFTPHSSFVSSLVDVSSNCKGFINKVVLKLLHSSLGSCKRC